MKYIIALFLTVLGIIVLIWGDKSVNIRRGKLLRTLDSLKPAGKLAKFSTYMVKTAIGLTFIYLAIWIALLNK